MGYQHPDQFPCCFCESFAGRLPYQAVVEAELCRAFVTPSDRGSVGCLVCPTRHMHAFAIATDDETVALAHCLRTVTYAMAEVYHPDGMHVWTSTGTIAGQSVAHAHFQVQLRFRGRPYSFRAADDLPSVPMARRQQIAAQLRDFIQSGHSDASDQECEQDLIARMGIPDQVLAVCEGGSDAQSLEHGVLIAETEHSRAISGARLRTPGHTVVVPKRPVAAYFLLTREESTDLLRLVRRIAKSIEVGYDPHGLSTWWEMGGTADQKYRHMAVELVPRRSDIDYKYRDLDAVPPAPIEDRLETAERVRHHLQ